MGRAAGSWHEDGGEPPLRLHPPVAVTAAEYTVETRRCNMGVFIIGIVSMSLLVEPASDRVFNFLCTPPIILCEFFKGFSGLTTLSYDGSGHAGAS
ncbi:MAG: hypothetical protein FD129_2839 [bacterium]|nr:MAG: hypothetical protein FD129_2839 [bacterium]